MGEAAGDADQFSVVVSDEFFEFLGTDHPAKEPNPELVARLRAMATRGRQ